MKLLKFIPSSKRQVVLIALVCLTSLLLYFKSSSEPISELIKGSRLEVWFYQFGEGNNLLNNVSLGILVSTTFWFFNVFLPEEKARKSKLQRLNRVLKLILEANEGSPFKWDKHYLYCDPLSKVDLANIKKVRELIHNQKIHCTLIEKSFYEICNESYELFRF